MHTDFNDALKHDGTGNLWAIVLAGGDGNRLASITSNAYGYPRPKQFCALLSGASLLEETIQRVHHCVAYERIIVSTTRRWRREANQCLTDLQQVQICEQPSNRGTTPGLLTSLLAILAVDPGAQVVICPADHYVSDDAAFMKTAKLATALLQTQPSRVVLLGAHLDEPSPGLGWIRTAAVQRNVPNVVGLTEPNDVGPRPWSVVEAFVEKPTAGVAAELHAGGALANTFAMVAYAKGLAALIADHCPQWWTAACGAYGRRESLVTAYTQLDTSDLSREVLQRSSAELRVLPLTGVHWSDIGTEDRLANVTASRPQPVTTQSPAAV